MLLFVELVSNLKVQCPAPTGLDSARLSDSD